MSSGGGLEDPQRDAPARRGELERVREQVVDRLAEASRVALDRRDGLNPQVQLDLALVCQRTRDLAGVDDERAQVDARALQLNRASVQLRGEQEVADDPQQPLPVAADDAEEARCSSLIWPASPSSSSST
jgi:hypothetical protein